MAPGISEIRALLLVFRPPVLLAASLLPAFAVPASLSARLGELLPCPQHL
ncbi:MAG: hypothetical protein ACP5I3_10185 [Thermoproteus sp.]